MVVNRNRDTRATWQATTQQLPMKLNSVTFSHFEPGSTVMCTSHEPTAVFARCVGDCDATSMHSFARNKNFETTDDRKFQLSVLRKKTNKQTKKARSVCRQQQHDPESRGYREGCITWPTRGHATNFDVHELILDHGSRARRGLFRVSCFLLNQDYFSVARAVEGASIELHRDLSRPSLHIRHGTVRNGRGLDWLKPSSSNVLACLEGHNEGVQPSAYAGRGRSAGRLCV